MGSAHASFAAADQYASVPLLDVTTIPQTQQVVDALLYTQYLEDDLHAFYVSSLASMSHTGLRSMHCMYPQAGEMRPSHAGPTMSPTGTTTSIRQRPRRVVFVRRAWISRWLRRPDAPLGGGGPCGWAKWETCHGPLGPSLRADGRGSGQLGRVVGELFHPGDPFYPAYYNDQTSHGNRFRMLDSFPSAGDHVNDFLRPLFASIFLRQDVTEMTGAAVDIPFNDRYLGTNPRNTFRAKYYYLSGLPLPLYPAGGPHKVPPDLDERDGRHAGDQLAPRKSWTTMLGISSHGRHHQHAPDVPQRADQQRHRHGHRHHRHRGGLAASATQPVLTLSAAHTLADNDVIHVSNISGTAGNNFRNARIRVKVGTGNNIRAESGLNLTSYSGYATADWTEGGNVHSVWAPAVGHVLP